MNLISIVIPIYNVEAYLDRCVQSVVNQTYKNLEIILVDDGSPDNCPVICDAWAQKDSRIKVIHKKNEGLGYARNTGIDNATGDYICFFDSDDYVESTLVEACYQVAIREKADIVSYGNDNVTAEGKIAGERIPSPPKDVYTGDEIKKKLIPRLLSNDAETGEDWKLILSACYTLISVSLIQKTGWRFVSEREIISEDFYSMFELYQQVEKAAFIRKVLYHYSVNPKSLSRVYRKDRYTKIKQLVAAMTALSEKYHCDVEQEISSMFLGGVMSVIKQIAASKENNKRKLIKEVITDEYLQNVLSNYHYAGEGKTKKILFWAMKKKKSGLCYVLSAARNMKG